MEEKVQNLLLLSEKTGFVRVLIDRNKYHSPVKSIGFPFFVVEPSNEEGTELFIKMQSDLKKALLCSNRNLRIYGDLELLHQLPLMQTDNNPENKMSQIQK